jgi:hypothetical protein
MTEIMTKNLENFDKPLKAGENYIGQHLDDLKGMTEVRSPADGVPLGKAKTACLSTPNSDRGTSAQMNAMMTKRRARLAGDWEVAKRW